MEKAELSSRMSSNTKKEERKMEIPDSSNLKCNGQGHNTFDGNEANENVTQMEMSQDSGESRMEAESQESHMDISSQGSGSSKMDYTTLSQENLVPKEVVWNADSVTYDRLLKNAKDAYCVWREPTTKRKAVKPLALLNLKRDLSLQHEVLTRQERAVLAREQAVALCEAAVSNCESDSKLEDPVSPKRLKMWFADSLTSDHLSKNAKDTNSVWRKSTAKRKAVNDNSLTQLKNLERLLKLRQKVLTMRQLAVFDREQAVELREAVSESKCLKL